MSDDWRLAYYGISQRELVEIERGHRSLGWTMIGIDWGDGGWFREEVAIGYVNPKAVAELEFYNEVLGVPFDYDFSKDLDHYYKKVAEAFRVPPEYFNTYLSVPVPAVQDKITTYGTSILEELLPELIKFGRTRKIVFGK